MWRCCWCDIARWRVGDLVSSKWIESIKEKEETEVNKKSTESIKEWKVNKSQWKNKEKRIYNNIILREIYTRIFAIMYAII